MSEKTRDCPRSHYYDEWWACAVHNTLIDVDVLAKLRADLAGAQGQVAALRANLAAAREALEKFGRHEAGCASYQRTAEQGEGIWWPPCSCGFAALLVDG